MKINSTGKMAEKVSDVIAESAPQKATAENSVHTGIAGASDSFVRSPAEKSFAAEKAKQPGVVAGLKVAIDSKENAVKLSPGLAVDKKGKSIHGSDYFYGKRISESDLQKDQEYLKSGDQGKFKSTKRHFTETVTTGADLQRDQDYRKSVAGTYTEATRANAALNRLSTLTGKSIEELSALLNQYGLDAGNPPNPPDNKVNAFIHDPAFASIPPQAILQALYGQ